MMEAVIVLPLLVIFLVGILEAGRTSSTIARAAQSAYNATLIGGKTSRSVRFGAMNQRAQDLNSFMVRDLINISMTPTEDIPNRTVSYEYQANLKPIFPNLDWGVGLEFTGPDLVFSSSTVVNYNQFENGTCYYNCNLQITNTCPAGGVVAPMSCSGNVPIDPRTLGGSFSLRPLGEVGIERGWRTQIGLSALSESF